MQWYKRYVVFPSQVTGRIRHPKELGAAEVTAFLTNLAVNRKLAAYSQKEDAKPSLSRPFFLWPGAMLPECGVRRVEHGAKPLDRGTARLECGANTFVFGSNWFVSRVNSFVFPTNK